MRWVVVSALVAGCAPVEKVGVDQIEEPARGSLVGYVSVSRNSAVAAGRGPWVVAYRQDAERHETRDLRLVADIDRSGVFVFPGAVRGTYALSYVIPLEDGATCVFRATAVVAANLVTLREDEFEPKLGDCHACTFVKPNADSCI